MEHTKLAILGAGVTGLCAAHLAQRAHGADAVLVLEAADAPGGTTRTEHVDAFALDWGPNGFLDREPLTLEWIRELGIEDQLVRADQTAAHRFIVRDDRIMEVVPPPRFLLTPVLSLRGRARMTCEPFIRAKRDDADESIWAFAARRIGPEAADYLVSPMVTGIFAGDARQLSLASCFPRMAAMEREYGGLIKALIAKRLHKEKVSPMGPRGVLTTFKEGIGYLPRIAAERLGDGRCRRLRLNAKALAVRRAGNAYRIEVEGKPGVEAERVIIAVPAHTAAAITTELPGDPAKHLAAIPYADVAVVCTAYPRDHVAHDVNGFGFVVPRNQGKRVLGCLWTSALFPGQAPAGHVLLRTMYGGYTDPDAVTLTDNGLLDLLKREVHPLLGIHHDPELVRIYRHRPGIPQYLLGHAKRVAAIRTAQDANPGLAFAGNAYRGVGLNDCVLAAHRAVATL